MATTCNDPASWVGRTLRGNDGSALGTITQVYADGETGEMEWLAVRATAQGARARLVPAVGMNPRGVRDVVSFWDPAALQGAPAAGSGTLSASDLAQLRRHYGMDAGDAGGDADSDGEEVPAMPPPAKPAPAKAAAPRRRSGSSLTDIEGLEDSHAEVLQGAGVRTIASLLSKGGTAAGRRVLAKETGFGAAEILEWVNRADLMRVKGVGSEYSDLLEASGVDTVKELKMRKPANLQARMAEINDAEHLVRRTPSLAAVERWVSEAKALPVAVTY